MLTVKRSISVGARKSPLSLAQVKEVFDALIAHCPDLQFAIQAIQTKGDRDQTTSLRTMDKTDFFTQELDEMLLAGLCDVCIHSAKDLPEPLPAGLSVIALTKGVDSSDSLVLREGIAFDRLPPKPVIATSSIRREEAVRELLPQALFVDIRGSIDKRLAILDRGEMDGVVIATAALIRLEKTARNRVVLLGPTAPLQGRLAIVAREDNLEMRELFGCLDER